MTIRTEQIGEAVLYLGDCREILPTLAAVDAIVTDPPYGLGEKWAGGSKKWKLHHGQVDWDKAVVEGLVPLLLGASKQLIVWGGHLYPFPESRGWMIWDKIVRNFSSGHCEIAWTNLDQPIRAFSYSHGELANEGKLHPTQKPEPLMTWCVGFTDGTVCDPFMGSGTTGVSCAKLRRKFIGIELETRYFDIARRRIEEAYRQPDMFVEAASAKSKAQQLHLPGAGAV